mgnify:CR=1 FL=1
MRYMYLNNQGDTEMTKLSAAEKKTPEIVVKTGFTFKGDSQFKSFRQATITLNKLERIGYLVKNDNEYKITPEGRDAA